MHAQNSTEHDQLVVLYTLQTCQLDLREEQLAKILGSLRLMDFFDLKEALLALVQNGQVAEVLTIQGPTYRITAQGTSVIEALAEKVRLSAREGLDRYMKENHALIEKESSYLAAYTKLAGGQYRVQARIVSDNTPVFQMSMLVGTKEEALAFVGLWPRKGEHMYQRVLLELTIPEDEEPDSTDSDE